MDFKIYYDDREPYIGDPYLAPGFGALLVIEKDKDHGRRIIAYGDYYVYDDRGEGLSWWAADYPALIDYLCRPGPRKVLIGRMIPRDRWNAIYKAADSDPDFPDRTAYAYYEPKVSNG